MPGQPRLHGADHDDFATTTFHHALRDRFRHVEHGREIRADDRVPFFGGELGDGVTTLDAGVVDQDIWRALAVHKVIESLLGVLGIRDIKNQVSDRDPQGLRQLLGCLGNFRGIPALQSDARPSFC